MFWSWTSQFTKVFLKHFGIIMICQDSYKIVKTDALRASKLIFRESKPKDVVYLLHVICSCRDKNL